MSNFEGVVSCKVWIWHHWKLSTPNCYQKKSLKIKKTTFVVTLQPCYTKKTENLQIIFKNLIRIHPSNQLVACCISKSLLLILLPDLKELRNPQGFVRRLGSLPRPRPLPRHRQHSDATSLPLTSHHPTASHEALGLEQLETNGDLTHGNSRGPRTKTLEYLYVCSIATFTTYRGSVGIRSLTQFFHGKLEFRLKKPKRGKS